MQGPEATAAVAMEDEEPTLKDRAATGLFVFVRRGFCAGLRGFS